MQRARINNGYCGHAVTDGGTHQLLKYHLQVIRSLVECTRKSIQFHANYALPAWYIEAIYIQGHEPVSFSFDQAHKLMMPDST